MQTVIVVPAYNEEQTVGQVITSLTPYANCIVVVDDGSNDSTVEVAKAAGALVISHRINRGVGAALGTGIAAALQLGAEAVVTCDADGQHLAEDIPRLLRPIQEGIADVTLGTRTSDRAQMPVRRRMYNWIGNALTYVLFGIWVKDSQCGFRAFSRSAAEVLEIRCDRMEALSEMIKEIKRHQLRYVEVPIVPIYTDYSMSKGQSFIVGIATAFRLLLQRFVK